MNETIVALTINLHQMFKKMHRELTPGKNKDSILIDSLNHCETLVQQIETENKII